MIKINEDELFVYYTACQPVQGDSYISKSGNIRYLSITKYATIKYNKNNHYIEYIWEKTDPYFYKNKNISDHMLALILGKMNRCNKAGLFPETTGIATG